MGSKLKFINRKDELIQEVLEFYEKYGELTCSRLKKEGYESLFTRMWIYSKTTRSKKEVCKHIPFFWFFRIRMPTLENHNMTMRSLC